MGVDLIPIATHDIDLTEQSFDRACRDILDILEKITLPNPEFLRAWALWWHDESKYTEKNVRTIRQINTKTDWTVSTLYESEYYAEYPEIEVEGPFTMTLYFMPGTLQFGNPHDRYSRWFKMPENYRNEWLKYFYTICQAFGAKKLLYLSDGEFQQYIDGTPQPHEIEADLRRRFGSPVQHYHEVGYDPVTWFLEEFKTLDWKLHKPIEDYLPEPDDRITKTADRSPHEFTHIKTLYSYGWQHQFLLQKKVGDKLLFRRAGHTRSLFFEHSGTVGGAETWEVRKDVYAPFTFDRLRAEAENADYSDLTKSLVYIEVPVNGKISSWRSFIEMLGDYLEFKGIGDKGYSVSDSHLCKFYISGLTREMLIEPILTVGHAPTYPFAIKDAETEEVLLRVREYGD